MKKIIPSLLLVFLFSCENQQEGPAQIQSKIRLDKDFTHMMSLGLQVNARVEELRSTYSPTEIDILLSKDLVALRGDYRLLTKRYPNFSDNAKQAVENHEFFEALKLDLKKKQPIVAAGIFEGVCGYTDGPCGPGGSSVNHVHSCQAGCYYAGVECLGLEGGASFCSQVVSGCNNQCCLACLGL